jgi:hypothetical protein
MRAGVAALCLAASVAGAAEGPVPPAYHGLWAREPADCARGDDLLVLVSAHGLGEPGVGDAAVAATGPDGPDATLHLTMRSRDGAAVVTYTLRLSLSDGGAALDFAMPPPAPPLRLHRCAKRSDAG